MSRRAAKSKVKRKIFTSLEFLEDRRVMAVAHDPVSTVVQTSLGASTPAPKTTTPAPTIKNTWIAANVKDANLKSFADAHFADGTWDRNDMIGLLHAAGNDGVVSAQELADLRAFVAVSQTQFKATDAVFNLANKVVNSNAANANYQGKALGNLAAGDVAAKLNNLVDKWFEGTDRPVAKAGDGTVFKYAQASGQLFVGGATYTDIHQGYLGDCYFLDALAATAKANSADIVNMFTDNGDGTFTVRFFNNGKADFVTVDKYLPVSGGRFVFANIGQSATSASNELWVGLAEKAYVEMNEAGWLRSNKGNSYNLIEGGYIANAFAQVTGKASTLGQKLDQTQLINALKAGFMVGLASKSNPASTQIVGGHAYFITGYNAATGKFTVFNPWGMNNGSQYAGTVDLTWDQLVGSFAYWDKGAA